MSKKKPSEIHNQNTPAPGAFSGGNVVEVDIEPLYKLSSLDSEKIAKLVIENVYDEYEVVSAIDVSDDIFDLLNRCVLKNEDIEKIYKELGIKYENDTLRITEAPENLIVIYIWDGYGHAEIILRKKSEVSE